jgi:hypothetical protein
MTLNRTKKLMMMLPIGLLSLVPMAIWIAMNHWIAR